MRRTLFIVLALVLAAGLSFAQGTQTATLSGTVLSSDRAPLPGATVSVKSPALLGTRTAVTDANGGYIFKALPPGTYKVTYELAGFASVEKTVTLALGATVPSDATMKVATVQETVTVTAEQPTPLNTTQVGANIKKEVDDTLASGRRIDQVALLAPGLTSNTPNAQQVTIAGSFAYDNVFLLDGVDINDNLFGNANAMVPGALTPGIPGDAALGLVAVPSSGAVVYEIVQTNTSALEQLSVPVIVSYNNGFGASTPVTGQSATASVSFAPISPNETPATAAASASLSIPRFVKTGGPSNAFVFNPCFCNILFPYVTTQFGYETGVAISNTSADPFGTAASTGTSRIVAMSFCEPRSW